MEKTLALRLYGKNDVRLEEFELPEIKDNEILADVYSDSICMSTYKVLQQGEDHKRVPPGLAENPIIVGHEICGHILKLGKNFEGKYKIGQKYSVQPAMNYPGKEWHAPGYSFPYFGGNATKVIIPHEIMDMDCLLTYDGEGYFMGSLVEVMSCIVGGFNVQYHFEHGSYQHEMGIVEGGALALLGGTGPMGLGAIDYAIHGPRKPKTLLVTDIDQARLDRAEHLFSKEEARKNGVDVHYVNTSSASNQDLIDLADGVGYHDAFVFAPVPALVEQASDIMCENGCLNFFAGPTNTEFKSTINFYKVHYAAHHVAANSGGNTEDMRIALKYMSEGKLNPAIMITHVGGLDSTADTLANLPNIGGGKKLVYNHISLPMTAIDDFESLGKDNELFRNLAEICARHDGLWSVEAEDYLLNNAPKMPGVE